MQSKTKTVAKTAPKTAPKFMAYSTVFKCLTAFGLPRPNLKFHQNNGRITPDGTVTASGKVYFSARNLDSQMSLRVMMQKAGESGFATPDGHKFVPVQNQALTHCPMNPGSYSAYAIRAWFSLAVAVCK